MKNYRTGKELSTLKDKIYIEKIFTKYAGSDKFISTPREFPREGNPGKPIRSYTDQNREHMITNGMCDVLYLLDPQNKDKK